MQWVLTDKKKMKFKLDMIIDSGASTNIVD